jgi:LytR cell envelope-related transcriptional attenuator
VTALTVAVRLPRPRDAARLILQTAARGAAIIGAAVVLGVVLLQVIDDGGSGPSANGGGGNGSAPETTTTTANGDGDGAIRPPEAVKIVVLNGSGVPGAAQAKSNELRTLGYANQEPFGNANLRVGNVVQCKAGFEREGQALAEDVGAGTQVEGFPAPAPPEAGAADCIVVLGSA